MIRRRLGEAFAAAHERASFWASLGPRSRRAGRFAHFGERSIVCWPWAALYNERYIWIGDDTMIGPDVSLSAGMMPGQECISSPVVRIGDRCLIGRGSGIVGHFSIEIGNDVWTGHHVYITDQNHGYERLDVPISRQSQPERPVRIGDGSWLGHGTVVLPGVTIGKHVVIGANSVVTDDIPDRCVAAGVPARVLRRHVDGVGWERA